MLQNATTDASLREIILKIIEKELFQITFYQVNNRPKDVEGLLLSLQTNKSQYLVIKVTP